MTCTSSSCRKNQGKEAKAKTLAYHERNKMCAVFSLLMKERGYDSFLWPESDAWWVLFVYTPFGQVSWHLPQREAIELYWVPTAETNPWDGHTTEEKYRRIEALMQDLR